MARQQFSTRLAGGEKTAVVEKQSTEREEEKQRGRGWRRTTHHMVVTCHDIMYKSIRGSLWTYDQNDAVVVSASSCSYLSFIAEERRTRRSNEER